jgi:hypothetical protein
MSEQQKHGYPYPDDPGGTHWHECWRNAGHHNCAVAEIERLREQINQLVGPGIISQGKAAEMQGLRMWQWRESLRRDD